MLSSEKDKQAAFQTGSTTAPSASLDEQRQAALDRFHAWRKANPNATADECNEAKREYHEIGSPATVAWNQWMDKLKASKHYDQRRGVFVPKDTPETT